MMQKYVTPQPGRTPGANIIDEPHYKLNVELTELRNENWQLVISTWIPETGWTKKELFLTMEELKRFQETIKH